MDDLSKIATDSVSTTEMLCLPSPSEFSGEKVVGYADSESHGIKDFSY